MLDTIVSILGLAFLGVFGWVIDLGNRVSIVETKHDGLILLINTRFNEMSRRLGRIEKSLNGHLRAIDSDSEFELEKDEN